MRNCSWMEVRIGNICYYYLLGFGIIILPTFRNQSQDVYIYFQQTKSHLYPKLCLTDNLDLDQCIQLGSKIHSILFASS
jgi:hypothetical protein